MKALTERRTISVAVAAGFMLSSCTTQQGDAAVPTPSLAETRARVPELLAEAVAAFNIPSEDVFPLGPLEDSCDDSSLPNGTDLVRVTDDTSLLLPAAEAQAQVEAARTALEARGWIGEGTSDDRIRLAVPGDYGVILTIPEDGRILVTVSAPCARP